MKSHTSLLTAALLAAALTGCASPRKPATPAPTAAVGKSLSDGKSVKGATDDLDEYAVAGIADPLEPVNRVTFWLNHQLYTFVLRPVSKTYEFILPKPVRKGIYNVFDNVEFPVRFVNHALQGKFQRAGQETGKFVVNSVLGVGGLIRMSDKFPAIANVPVATTGQTFAKWGLGNGLYIVLPVIGPSSARDTAGLAGDVALNPVTWIGFIYGTWAWTIPVSAADTVSVLPERLSQYDAATKNALDRYLSARTAYAQFREEQNRK